MPSKAVIAWVDSQAFFVKRAVVTKCSTAMEWQLIVIDKTKYASAMVFTSDSVFSDEDWESSRKMYQSSKATVGSTYRMRFCLVVFQEHPLAVLSHVDLGDTYPEKLAFVKEVLETFATHFSAFCYKFQ